jgi:chorismate dehydratase
MISHSIFYTGYKKCNSVNLFTFVGMKSIRISAVSYYNTLPLIYGIKESGLLDNYRLELAVPSVCASNLLSGYSDIALVPVGALPDFHSYELVGNYCIGAEGDVKTVLLLANQPVELLDTVYLDTDSRTSVSLVKILAQHKWKKEINWVSLKGKDPLKLHKGEGVVLIGDKTFDMRPHFSQEYDLAGEWYRYTGLPFVFAAWITVSKLPDDFLHNFEAALNWGVNHIEESVRSAINLRLSHEALISYLKNDINFILDAEKRTGLNLFLEHLGKIQQFENLKI